MVWLLVLGSLGAAIPPSLPGVDWPHWRGPERDGKTSASLGEVTGYATPVPMPEAMGRPGTLALLRKEFLSAIDPFTGEIFWSAPYQSLNATDPVVEGREVLLSSIGGSVLLRLEADGETTAEVWARKDYRNYFNPPVKVGDHLYGFDGTTHNPTRLVCIDWATGEERWGVEGHAKGGLILAGDLLVACDQGEILLFRPDPDRFDLVLRETVLPGKCWTAPVVSDGRLYARNAAGRVVCLEAVESSAPRP